MVLNVVKRLRRKSLFILVTYSSFNCTCFVGLGFLLALYYYYWSPILDIFTKYLYLYWLWSRKLRKLLLYVLTKCLKHLMKRCCLFLWAPSVLWFLVSFFSVLSVSLPVSVYLLEVCCRETYSNLPLNSGVLQFLSDGSNNLRFVIGS